MPKRPYRTAHQRELMSLILISAGQGQYLCVTDIHGLITYGASFGAVRKSLAALESQDMIQRQKHGRKTILVPTERGYDWFRPRTH